MNVIAPSLPAAIGLHAKVEVARLLRVSRAWPAVAVLLATLVIGGLVAFYTPIDLLITPRFFGTFALPALALVALGYGTGSLRADGDRGALSLFVMRPRGWLAVPLGRLIATGALMSLAGLALGGFSFGVAAAFAVPPIEGHLPHMLLAGALAGAVYTAMFMFVAATFQRATAASLTWLIGVDLTLARHVDALAVISPGPLLADIATRAPDLPLVGAGSGDLWMGALNVVAIGLAAAGLLIWRFRGDSV